MNIQKKRSFAELTESVEAEKQNSDLLNLANAKVAINAQRLQLEKFYKALTEELAETEKRLLDMATTIEAGQIYDVRDVKVVYDLAYHPKAQFEAFEIRR